MHAPAELAGPSLTERRRRSPSLWRCGGAAGQRRRKEGGFPGAATILDQLNNKTEKIKRVGLVVEGVPARAGYSIHSADGATKVGNITSGSPSPSLKQNIAMGYVQKDLAKLGTKVKVSVRGELHDATIAKMPFVPHKYYRLK